jgi:thiol:disulfide interchange protein
VLAEVGLTGLLFGMKFSRFILPLLLVGFAVVLFVNSSSGPVGTPEAFAEGLTLDEAKQRSNQSGKPVLVFATADWCGPCQRLKRTTLADARVNETILARTEPVYLDLTYASSDAALAAVAQQLGVGGIPDLMLIRHGDVIARQVGGASANDLIAWLESY